jgi:hypothetical protein
LHGDAPSALLPGKFGDQRLYGVTRDEPTAADLERPEPARPDQVVRRRTTDLEQMCRLLYLQAARRLGDNSGQSSISFGVTVK